MAELALMGRRASARAAIGDMEGAAQDVRIAMQRIDARSIPSSPLLADACNMLAEAAFAWCARSEPIDDRATLERTAATICVALRQTARAFVAAQPASLLWTGHLHLLRGRARRAERCWRKALVAAERLQFPFEEAQIRSELGRLLEGRSSEAAVHLTRARELFLRLGAAHELERLDRARAR